MRLLLIDFDRTGLDMAYRAAEAGHEVRWWMPPHQDGTMPLTGDGFPGITKVKDWEAQMSWAKPGLVVNLFNDRKLTQKLMVYRQAGWKVFGPSVRSARLEWERGEGMKLFEQHGMEVPKYHTFPTLQAALTFATKQQDCFVFKTLGDEEDKSLSFVPSDPAELVAWLENKIKRGVKLKGSCLLQEKVDLLCEVGISGWLGPHGFLPDRFNVNFEHKKLMPGDLGPNTGEMGTVCKYVDGDGQLAQLLQEFEEPLIKLGHTGDTDIGGAITKDGRFLPFEWSLRFGWPSTFILFASHLGDPVEWMLGLLEGRDELEVDDRVAIGVVMAQPPFPQASEDHRASEGQVVKGLEEVWDHVSPVELMLKEGPIMKEGRVARDETYQTTGDYICCVTSLGPDVHDVIPEVQAVADRIKFPDKIFRDDIGKGLEQTLPKARALGFEELPEY